jgi:uncharacterized protein YndB with AHSA1/START domain
MSTDRIQKSIVLRAPRARVWRAIADAQEFGSWFRVKLEGSFAPGATVRGRITYPGYEHATMTMRIERMDFEELFAFRWHPGDGEPTDPSEPTTLVEFRLEEIEGGTRLTVVESGFDQIPLPRRAEAFRSNEQGWAEQMKNIETHVAA